MKLNLLPILNFDGKKIHIDEKVSVSPRHDDTFEICAPVEFDGTVQNVGGTIELCGTAEARLKLFCDRCGEEYETTLRFALNESFKKADEFSTLTTTPIFQCLKVHRLTLTRLFIRICSLICRQNNCAVMIVKVCVRYAVPTLTRPTADARAMQPTHGSTFLTICSESK